MAYPDLQTARQDAFSALPRLYSVQGRVQALLSLGFLVVELAVLASVTPRTIKRWADGGDIKSHDPARSLDDLFSVSRMLVADGTYSDRDIVGWFRSRNELLRRTRPLDALHAGDEESFRKVAAAAEVLIHPELLAQRFGEIAVSEAASPVPVVEAGRSPAAPVMEPDPSPDSVR